MSAPGSTDDHAKVGEEQLRAISDALKARYPDESGREEREAALSAARRLVAGDETVVDELAEELASLRRKEALVKAALAQAARMVVQSAQPGSRGHQSEIAFARRVGLNRLTIRGWLDK